MRTALRTTLTVAAAAAAVSTIATSTALAEPVHAADHQITWKLDGGATATVSSTGEVINKVPPLTTDGTTREGFATLTASTSVAGATPGTVGTLVTGYQIGCMASFQGVGIGANATVGIGGTAGTGGGSLGPNASIGPSITVNLGPGEITDVPLGKKSMVGPDATIRVRNAHIKVNGCIGPVTARSYTTVQLSTPASDDGNTVYGTPVGL